MKNVNMNPDAKLSFLERFAYGIGDYAGNLIYSAISAFLLVYYTNVIGASAAAAASIIAISKFLDGISDLAMGYIVDHTHSKWGKARPWIARLCIPLAVCTVLMFSVPSAFAGKAQIAYMFLTYNLVSTIFYTGINVPYATMQGLMTMNQYERGLLGNFRNLLATAGTMTINTVVLKMTGFFGGGDAYTQKGWTMTFVVFGFLEIVTFMITFLFTRERVNTTEDENRLKIPVSLGFKALVKNKYWFMATLNLILIFIAQGINGSAEVYYTKIVLGNSSLVGTFSVALQATQIICMFFIAGFVKKFGKRNVLMTGAAVMIVGYGIMGLASENLTLLIAGCILRGVGNAGISACMFAMVTDTIEYGEWKTGIRTEGLINSAASFGQKIGNGLSSVLLGAILSIGGYVGTAASQSASAITAIRTSYIYVPIILTVIQIIVLFFYHLDEEYDSILNDLKSRRISK